MAKDNGYDGILDKYEALCARCVGLRQSAASGVDVSREEVQKAIDDFLTLNKLLKSFEENMTVVFKRYPKRNHHWRINQRIRFGLERGGGQPVQGKHDNDKEQTHHD